jgi:CheY-like chemotaxis protein
VRDILIADDEPGFRDLFVYALEPLGYRVTVVTDGAQAVAQVATRRFDLVVLDHHMPNVNGLQALEQIRALLPAQRVVMVSGSSADPADLAEQSLRRGAACCAFKPMELEQLVRTVQSQLEGSG